MKSCIARDFFAPSLLSVLPIAPLKWLFLPCMLILIFFFDSSVVFSATTAIPNQGNSDESPPDYSTSRVVGAMKVGGSSVVVFENAKGEQATYRTGETFADGSKIVTVKDDSIIVKLSDGSKVEYFVTQNGAGKAGTPSTGRPVTANPATAPPPAYIPPPASVSSEPKSGRVPRRTRHRTSSADVEE
jgi:hypothetical protein